MTKVTTDRPQDSWQPQDAGWVGIEVVGGGSRQERVQVQVLPDQVKYKTTMCYIRPTEEHFHGVGAFP